MTNHLPELAEGEIVHVSIERARSGASHKHQFAWVKDAWLNLPETVAFEPWAATPETLRKHALCQTGYFVQSVIDCGDDKIARAVASQIVEARRKSEGYAHSVIRQGVAVIRWPESQSLRAMGRDRFQQSKTAIMDWIAAQIGCAPEELARMQA